MSDFFWTLVAGDNIAVLVIGFLAGHYWATRKMRNLYQAGKDPFKDHA